MDMIDTIHELLDNMVQRLESEKESTGRDLTYFVFITDTGTGRGDLRFNGDVDALAGMLLRLNKALFSYLETEEVSKVAVEGLTVEKMKMAANRLNEMADEDPDFDFDEQ